VTSISEAVATQLDTAVSLEAALTETAALIERETGTRSCFCRLHGRRWSHLAGVAGAVLPEMRLEIAPGWGVIAEDNQLSKEEWQKIGALLPG